MDAHAEPIKVVRNTSHIPDGDDERVKLIRLVIVMLASASFVVAGPSPTGAAVTVPPYPELLPLHAMRGSDPGLFDSDGRRVVLRGVNYNKLGDYDQPNPAYPTVVPERPDDFPGMARLGFNVVRLLVHWSALEPTEGDHDEAYLDRISVAVAAAKANGLYVVIDMHQDAWGRYIGSPPGTACPGGSFPAVGWDGAPAWATIFDPGPGNVNTCRTGSRENTEAVMSSWDNFYLDTAGIQSRLVATWRVLANRFGTEPAVAGFDLLNEPNSGHPASSEANRVLLGQFYDRAIDAIRAGEADAATATAVTIEHPIIFETFINWTPVPYDFTDDQNLILSGHNYAGSMSDTPVEEASNSVEFAFAYFSNQARRYGTTLWIGEYGFFRVTATKAATLRHYGIIEDQLASDRLVGSAWWQFEQACGDPHSIGLPGGNPRPELVHLKRSSCPGDAQGEPIPEWTTIISRAYPRVAPGKITALTSDGAARTMSLAGTAGASDVGKRFVLWAPGPTAPIVSGTGIEAVTVTPVDGGTLVTGTVSGDYTVDLAGAAPASERLEAPVVAPRFTG